MSIRREFESEAGPLCVTVDAKGEGRFLCRVGSRAIEMNARHGPDGSMVFEIDGRTFGAIVARGPGGSTHVRIGGHTHVLRAHEGKQRGGAAGGGGAVEAPMTGTVVQVMVAVGDTVTRGQTVGVLTAMKMEHKLAAGVDGVVTEIHAQAGVTVEQGTLLVRIDPAQKGA